MTTLGLPPSLDGMPECHCRQCLVDWEATRPALAFSTNRPSSRFIVCAVCGNKRCPHATDHRHDCTDSNEPGQAGSVYGDYELIPAADEGSAG
jgi:hypothetical protein